MSNKKSKAQKGSDADEHFVDGDDAVIGTAFRGSAVVLAIISILVGVVIIVMTREDEDPEVKVRDLKHAEVRDVSEVELPVVPFVDVTDSSGIDFKHTNGAKGLKLLPETMGSGAAFFDFDNDGDQDLFFVNSTHFPGDATGAARVPTRAPTMAPTMALYQNDGKGIFSNVTEECGVALTFYGTGVAVGDFDNDGWRDLFISAVGKNHLLKNHQGKFEEVTDVAEVGGDEKDWSSSCGWFDYDNDGHLDLFVCNYLNWTREIDEQLDTSLDGVLRAYAPPTVFEGTFPYLYHNEGDGTFTDVSESAGMRVTNPNTGVPLSKSLGVVFVDFDHDGWQDIVVANDTVQNVVFHNQHDGTFVEKGLLMGLAVAANGESTGAMGIDCSEYRDNRTLGIAVGNFSNEAASLYVSLNDTSLFSDEAVATGLGPETRLELTFGLFFFDYDLDGRLDLLTANGHLEDEINKVQKSQHYEQPPHLFWNAGPEQRTEFVSVPVEKVGDDLGRPIAGRGSAFADIDGDGDLDVLITSSGGAPRLLRNDLAAGANYLRILLSQEGGNLDAIGAIVECHIGERVMRRQVAPTRSYLSQSELQITFGLGKTTAVDKIVVHWPDGTEQEWASPETGKTLLLNKAKE